MRSFSGGPAISWPPLPRSSQCAFRDCPGFRSGSTCDARLDLILRRLPFPAASSCSTRPSSPARATSNASSRMKSSTLSGFACRMKHVERGSNSLPRKSASARPGNSDGARNGVKQSCERPIRGVELPPGAATPAKVSATPRPGYSRNSGPMKNSRFPPLPAGIAGPGSPGTCLSKSLFRYRTAFDLKRFSVFQQAPGLPMM
jgi:hypothetical protein